MAILKAVQCSTGCECNFLSTGETPEKLVSVIQPTIDRSIMSEKLPDMSKVTELHKTTFQTF